MALHDVAPSADPAARDSTENFDGFELRSAFQPVLSLSHRRAVGCEALIRPTLSDGTAVSPLDLFTRAQTLERTAALDSTCQRLHLRNFGRWALSDRWLFLNVSPATITDRAYEDGQLAEALEASGMPPQQLVVEILEGAIEAEPALLEAVEYFRSLGALIALDDFGTGHSNFDRIWRLAPDIIKLDRSIIVEATRHYDGRLRRTLPNLVSLMHEAGSMVLAEGIETEEQALVALDSDLDFAQGFFFAYPEQRILADTRQTTRLLKRLTTRFARRSFAREQQERQQLAPYKDTFRAAVEAIENGRPIEDAVTTLMRMPRVSRFYVLSAWGEEITFYLGNARGEYREHQSRPINDTRGSSWYRRPYFRNAIGEPRRLHISRPFLSGTGTYMCFTLSVATPDDPQRVFCCDVYS